MNSTHQAVYRDLQGPLSVQVQATCPPCGWEQDLEDCGSQLRAYLSYADHLREEAVADSRRTPQ
ncbi:hypothetical protein [Streptomyces sp. NPDC018584]|uniref:hypothetical protein n=1 Tax=unclassified Streptomyces TaxID=2593676 RepID=UPI0037BCABF4